MRSDWSTWESCIRGQWQRPPYKTDALGYVKDAKSLWRFGENRQKTSQHQKFPHIFGGCGQMWQMWRIDNLLLEIPLSLRSRCNWVLRVQRVRGNLFGHWRCGMDAPGDAYHPLSRSAPNRMRVDVVRQ